MQNNSQSRPGGEIIVDQLVRQGVDHVFCVPGESYLAVLDALHDASINVTVCRQEGGAAMMAEAHGKLTGRPGICMVTRGPGASNALAGIHIAKQDSTPLIVFVGQIETGMREREAFQEVDYRAVFGTQTKWTTEIDDATRIPELIARAFHVAMSGRPGPVVIALPEDMLVQMANVADAARVEPVVCAPAPEQMAQMASLLAGAKNPLAIVGGSRWTEEAVQGFIRFAEQQQLPVAVQFRRQHLFPSTHPNFVGDIGLGSNPKLLKMAQDADVILLVGGRMSEIASQSYTLLDIPVPRQTLIHVHADSQELNRVYQAALAINATPAQLVNAAEGLDAGSDVARKAYIESAHESYLAWSNPESVSTPGALQMGEVMAYLEAHLEPDAIMTNGAGNYATWLHRFHRFNHFNTQLAPTSGSMGYGAPAAVGAKRVMPQR
ncbi:MAG: thiamine pyrophosphate-binding protein, partial [Advenella sp.]